MTKRKAKTEVDLVIPSIPFENIELTIEGLSELVTQRMSDNAKAKLVGGETGEAVRNVQIRSPEDEFESSIYRTDDNKPGILAAALKKTAVTATRYSSLYKTVAGGAFHVVGPSVLPILGSTPRMRTDFIKKKDGATQVAYRAGYPLAWAIKFRITYNRDAISAAQLVHLYHLAGFSVGIGCGRAESGCGARSNGAFRVASGS